MTEHYITPNRPGCVGRSDSESIQNAIAAAKSSGLDTVVIPRRNERTGEMLWNISETILLPSGITIIIDNAHLRLADGVFCNMFRNENMYNEAGLSAEGEQHDIRILGRGNALLDGGNHNGLTERTSMKEGYPHIYHNSFILLHNVRDFEISGMTMTEPRWWCVNLIYCSYGRVGDIKVFARDNVPNQDGIDLRCGCHNIVVEDITGQGGDDLIALTGFQGTETKHAVAGRCIDIHSVVIRSIRGTSVTKAIVALRNHDGVRLHDILIDGIVDSAAGEPDNRPYAALRVGQNHYVHTRPSALGETFNINAQNIHSSRNTAVLLCSTLLNSSLRNIYSSGSAVCAVSTNTGAQIKNLLVDGVFYTADRMENTACAADRCGSHEAVFNFEHHEDTPALCGSNRSENVVISNVFASNLGSRPLLYASGRADVTIIDNAESARLPVLTDGGEDVRVTRI